MHFNFFACNQFVINALESTETFVEHFPDYQGVWLSNENELNFLFGLCGIRGVEPEETEYHSFPKLWNLTDFNLPVLTEEEYDKFIQEWRTLTKREETMNEYGTLLFLQGVSGKWNQLKHRFVVLEA